MTMRNDITVLATIRLRGGAVATLTPKGWQSTHELSQTLLELDRKQFPPPVYYPDWVAWTVGYAINHVGGEITYIRPFQNNTTPGQII